MTKAEEIKVLQSLKGGTYFAQVFPDKVIDQMCENIKMDFALDNGIETFEYSSAAQSYKAKCEELQEKVKFLELNESVMEKDYLRMKELMVKSALQAGLRYDSKEYNEIVQMVGLKYIVLYKINNCYVLTSEEKEYLPNNLK